MNCLSVSKSSTFASQSRKTNTDSREQKAEMQQQDGPFVYRLGRKIFILERGFDSPTATSKKNKELKID